MEVEKLLRDLVEIPSPSGEEMKLGEFVIRILKNNFKIKKQKVGNRFNILAYTGKPRILLNAHLDTVPEQLKIREDKKYIYGRGSCDTKASLASMICAAEKLLKEGISDFGLLFDVSEETDFSGIKKAIRIIPSSVKIAVVGEPTKLKLIIGQKGMLVFKLICEGKEAHGATPERGVNAIELLIKELEEIKKLKLPEGSLLGKNIINFAKISGGKADNLVPDYAEATIAMRITVNPKKILEILKKKLKFSRIEPVFVYEPVINLDARRLANALNLNIEIASYFTEAYFISKKAKSFVLGPGNIKYAHSKNEKILKKELKKAVNKYTEIITYLNQKSLGKSRKQGEK